MEKRVTRIPQRSDGGSPRSKSNGEWAAPRVLEVQFPGIEGNGLDRFKTDAKQTILWPSKYATGKMIYFYTAASQVASGTSAK
jgi:branched-chain amino acid transport system substrate-binding protein